MRIFCVTAAIIAAMLLLPGARGQAQQPMAHGPTAPPAWRRRSRSPRAGTSRRRRFRSHRRSCARVRPPSIVSARDATAPRPKATRARGSCRFLAKLTNCSGLCAREPVRCRRFRCESSPTRASPRSWRISNRSHSDERRSARQVERLPRAVPRGVSDRELRRSVTATKPSRAIGQRMQNSVVSLRR